MSILDYGMKGGTHLPPRATVTRIVAWLVVVGCATGCAAAFDPSPTTDLRDMSRAPFLTAASSHDSPDHTMFPLQAATEMDRNLLELPDADRTPTKEREPDPRWLSLTEQAATVRCHGTFAAGAGYAGNRICPLPGLPLFQERPWGNDVPLRPPLRQTWFHHPTLVPLGDDVEFDLPDSSVLAHRDRVSSRPLRNAYAGFRDQPLLHRDTSRDPVTNSTLPEIGPPPPHHAAKTVTTLIGGTLLGFAAYAFLPSSFTGTTKEGAVEEAWEHFQNAWTKPPVIDKDRAVVNYLGHPYFGMSFYLSQRNFGESPLRSFLFSTAMSTAFEYFIESWAERPSIQDLIITPIVGSIYGEIVYRVTQAMRKDGFTTAEKIAVTVLNPMYVLQNGYR